jgi:hypothetical protein
MTEGPPTPPPTKAADRLYEEIKSFLRQRIDKKTNFEPIIRRVNEYFLETLNPAPYKPLMSEVFNLAEKCNEVRVFWPELASFADPILSDYAEHITKGILLDRKLWVPKVESIKMYAPKFYTDEDTRQFNQKFESQKLREKARRIKKKVTREIAAETQQRFQTRETLQKRIDAGKARKFNRVLNEFQQQKKVIERENTQAERDKRSKRHGKRKAGT